MDALGVIADEPGGEAERGAGAELAEKNGVLLQREGGDAVLVTVGGRQADEVEPRIGGVIEHHHVIADVHVPIVVDPLLSHAVAVGFEGRGDVHGLLPGIVPAAVPLHSGRATIRPSGRPAKMWMWKWGTSWPPSAPVLARMR